MARTHRQRRWWAALALAVVGCSDPCGGSSTQPGAVGELGNGRFLYTCGGASDPACEGSSNGEPLDTFPDCIALGGTFDLEYELVDDSALDAGELTPVLYVESVNQNFFRGTDDFEALRVGNAAFLVRESERVLDLIHLLIVEPDFIDVVERDTGTITDAITLAPGATEVLLVLPRSSTCLELGGAVPIEADSSDTAVATVMAGEVLRIQAVAPGTAVVRARLGGIEQALTVTVGGEPVDPDTGPGEGSSDDEGTTGTASTEGSGTTDASGGSSTEGSGSSTTGGT